MSLLHLNDEPHNSDHEDTQSNRSHEWDLPTEILENIFAQLSIDTFWSISLVNSKWFVFSNA